MSEFDDYVLDFVKKQAKGAEFFYDSRLDAYKIKRNSWFVRVIFVEDLRIERGLSA